MSVFDLKEFYLIQIPSKTSLVGPLLHTLQFLRQIATRGFPTTLQNIWAEGTFSEEGIVFELVIWDPLEEICPFER